MTVRRKGSHSGQPAGDGRRLDLEQAVFLQDLVRLGSGPSALVCAGTIPLLVNQNRLAHDWGLHVIFPAAKRAGVWKTRSLRRAQYEFARE